MVKRKAEVDINKWLEGRNPVPTDCSTVAIAAEGEPAASGNPTIQVTSPSSTPGSSPIPVPAEPVVVPIVEVMASTEDEGHWFWALLEECGYERWMCGYNVELQTPPN